MRLIQKLLSHDQDSSFPRANLITSLSISGLAYPSVGFYPPGRIQLSREKRFLPASQPILFSILYQLLKQDRIGHASSPAGRA